MVQSPCLVALQELQTFPDPERQVHSLRKIKNDIVGHGLRKELVIRHGLLEPLQQILSSAAKASGKRSAQGSNGQEAHDGRHMGNAPWTIEDEVRLQAILILGSLANAGPAFVSPVLSGNIVPVLLASLVPGEVSPRIIIASLRTLNNLAYSWTLAEQSNVRRQVSPFCSQLFGKDVVQRYLKIFQQTVTTSDSQTQIHLTANLVAIACIEDVSRGSLVKAGVLDALASHLADYAAYSTRTSQKHPRRMSKSMNPNTLTSILNASAAIVENSDYRALRLAWFPAFRRAFLHHEERGFTSDGHDRQGYKLGEAVAIDALLPRVLAPVQKNYPLGSQSFPALGSSSLRYPTEHSISDVTSSDPFCIWLLHLARCQYSALSRMAALRLLALLSSAIETDASAHRVDVGRSRGRERQIALLAVPLAVRLVQDALSTSSETMDDNNGDLTVKEQAASVLAQLIQHSMELQRAAVEAGAIKYVSQLLRKSFDSVTLARPMWSAQAVAVDPQITANATAQMGEPGLPMEIAHAMKIRAGALRALGAIAQREDIHRKAIIEQGVVSSLIDSLIPFTATKMKSPTPTTVKEGNTLSVVIAACEAATALSRSVSLLRTSLIDAGIAKPVLALLQHPDNAVQVSATNVCCNIVLDFSPMRQDLMEAGALKTLCEHARRSNPQLRKASLWALKHLVLYAPKETKIEALDELGTGWLVQAISGEQRAESLPSSSVGMSTPNAAGERVDLLNAPDTAEMEVDMSDDDLANDEDDEDDGELLYDRSGTPYHSSGLRTTLKPDRPSLNRLRTLREKEQGSRARSRNEDHEIQEQALDFIRNFVNGEDAAAMADHLDFAIGLQRVFDLIHAKLEAPLPGATQSVPRSAAWKSTPTAIVASCVQILNHISAASARHKQLLIAQKTLLRAWVPHFSHVEAQIRGACVWTVINLTWVEGQSDRADAVRRAQELRSIGIEDKVRAMSGDRELDVRERTKTALTQMEELLNDTARHR